MHSLARVAVQQKDMAQPLPAVIPAMERMGMHIRRGQVTMMAALPGHGKTWLTLYLVIRWCQRNNLTCLYFSADSDEMTMATRAASILTHEIQDDMEAAIRSESVDVLGQLSQLDGLRFDFDPNPSFSHMEQELQAFNIVYGAFPDVIVVDNLMNIAPSLEDETANLKGDAEGLKRMAHGTGSAVIVLHHLAETSVERNKRQFSPAGENAITGRISQTPATIYTIHFDKGDMVMKVACVKQRGGKADSSGNWYTTLGVDPQRMLVGVDKDAAMTGAWA